MSKAEDFEERYKKGDLPWDTGEHDRHLAEVIEGYSISPCPVLELGAGTGSDALWLESRGFKVTAVDVSPTAIEMAQEKAQAAGATVSFIHADILRDELPAGPYSFVFDRGCFHIFDLPHERAALADIIWRHLAPEGLWFSLIGSTDGTGRDEGPPRRSVLDIASAVEFRFEIISLKAIEFDTNLPEPPRAWSCLMRKRSRK